MLHAFNQKNVRRILMKSQDEHSNEKSEDAVTSMIFSPLAFMAPPEALQALTCVVGDSYTKAVSGRIPIRHTFELWPQRLSAKSANGDSPTRCEPDLVSVFHFEHGPNVTFIGEMKWDWKMAPDALAQELRREREAVKRQHGGEQVAFVVSKYRSNREVGGAPVLTWIDVALRLASLLRGPTRGPVETWASLVQTFLEKADLVPFGGFVSFAPSEIRWNAPFAFWSDANG